MRLTQASSINGLRNGSNRHSTITAVKFPNAGRGEFGDIGGAAMIRATISKPERFQTVSNQCTYKVAQ